MRKSNQQQDGSSNDVRSSSVLCIIMGGGDDDGSTQTPHSAPEEDEIDLECALKTPAAKALDHDDQAAESPLENASFLSQLIFSWPFALLRTGMEHTLTDKDLPNIMKEDSSKYNRDYLLQLWREEQKRHPEAPKLQRALIRDFLKTTWHWLPLVVVSNTARVAQALTLGLLMESLETGDSMGFVWATVIVLCALIMLLEFHHVFFIYWRKGMQLRTASIAAIHDKALRLSSTHTVESAEYGHVMNLASNDVERLLFCTVWISRLCSAPVLALGVLGAGWHVIGPSFAVGFALFMVAIVPLQYYLAGRFAHYRSKIAEVTDQRVSLTSQAIRGARVMKMSGYEWRFLDRIRKYRRQEMHLTSKATTLKAWNETIFFFSNVVLSLVIFLVDVFTGGILTPVKVFTVFALVSILQFEMARYFPFAVTGVAESYSSVERIQKFLELAELPTTSPDAESMLDTIVVCRDEDDEVAISMAHVSCYWNGEKASDDLSAEGGSDSDSSSNPKRVLALDNVSVAFRNGAVTAVIGACGSGKSAILQALVQELPISSGSISKRYRTIAYAPQEAWLLNGTVKENILMGKHLDPEWYGRVVQACGLLVDFQHLRNGDETVVGDRGVQCSGGQRSRIGLARALYLDADVLVADDPLSAVDPKVGRQLYNEALLGLVSNRGKCVILATHQHHFITECTCVLVAEGGVSHVGSYEECISASNGRLVAHGGDASVDELCGVKMMTPEKDNEEEEVPQTDSPATYRSDGPDDSSKEMNEEGAVHFDVYLNYLDAMGGLWVGIALFILFSVTQAFVFVALIGMGKWSEITPVSEQKQDWALIGTLVALTVVLVLLSTLRAHLSFHLFIKASRQLHDNMAKAVLRAKQEFFDSNPVGRVVNRFSADVGSNDALLPPTLFEFLTLAFLVVGTLLVAVITLPFTILPFPFLLWYFFYVRKVFVASSRELKRLEGLARSRIFAMLGESLDGIATIRANGALDFFQDRFSNVHDSHTRAFFAAISGSRWMGFRVDLIMFLFVSSACYLAVVFDRAGWMDVSPMVLGFTLSTLLQLSGICQWAFRQSTEVVAQMVSVERVLGFGRLEPEAPLEKDEDLPLLEKGWPQRGSIKFEDLSVRYRATLPRALDRVNFSIPGGARVGVVGRTGCGKTSLVQALFRLLEAEEGRIIIDGVDTATLGLHTLRTNISVISQVPTLFSGCSVRENLDLFALHSDESLRRVLEDCYMSQAIDSLPDGWDSMVAEGGSNFSVGERQLLCLARAILLKNKVLVLDEATANVDRKTDHLLQEAINRNFPDTTILAVAHRLDTVIDNDYILVLGNGGRVLEFGRPAELIRFGGHFASMITETGPSASDLRQRAFEKELLCESENEEAC